MRTVPLGPSAELPMGHEAGEGCAKMMAGPHANAAHWGLRWSSLWGHEPCEGCAEVSMRWAGRKRADVATGALVGAPYGQTKCVRGVQKRSGAVC